MIPFSVTVGDKVAYSVAFLKSTGQSHSEAARARGTVTALKPLGEITLAVIDWNGADLPDKVAVPNLAKVGPNPRFCQC